VSAYEALRIGGARTDGVRRDAIRSPYSGEVVGEVAVGGAEDMDAAIASAARAFEETRRLPTHRRAAILEASARRIEERQEALARLMARESGKPITQCRAEATRAAITFRLGAAEALRLGGEVLPVDLEARGEGRLCVTTRVPRGPVAAISPFNFPLNLIAHKLAPAIAVGASVVLKPPPQCPLTGFALAAIIDESGWPAAALNVVHCPPDVAQRMVEDERMKVLSFTGSDVVGWRLKAVAGKKQVLLELGGNAPCIVDRDADLDRALPAITLAAFANAGQVCIRAQRLYVHRAIFDEVLRRFVEAARATPCGDPLDPATVVGPVIEPRHAERILAWVREAVDAGATLRCGGEARGQVVLPTVLTGAPRDAKVCREEVFGPVTVVEPFETFDEAIARCNDSRFGLQASVYTRDLGHALRAFRELEYGGVIVNDAPTFRIDNVPYGGTKDSGVGREGVRYAMEELTEPRVLVIREL
jgi:acyl-CoA reductase-like NAD-dependent aldehyde dehydrogenase